MISTGGFTLPELMVVLLIIALLAGGGGHFWQGWRERQQLSETATRLHFFWPEYVNMRTVPTVIYLS